MSIIPGIETAAPERTETRSGSAGIAEPLARRLLEPAHVRRDLALEPRRQVTVGHVGAAGVGRDREAGRNRQPERRHLREADPLAAEQLAPTARRLVEVIDETLRRHRRIVTSPLPAAGPELGEPGERPQCEPERREDHVEDEERRPEQRQPERPAGAGNGRLGLQRAAPARCSTVWTMRRAISSIESSETSITGQPIRLCTAAACSRSS